MHFAQTIQKTLYSATLTIGIILLTLPVYATPGTGDDAPPPPSEYLFENPLKSEYSSLTAVLLGVLKGITIILMPILALAIVYIGFKMVLAGKEKSADYDSLKKSFMWSLIGLFLVLGANGILSVIQNTVYEVIAVGNMLVAV